jgi:hypothetical protein
LRREEELDPVTRLLFDLHRTFELATAKTFTPKRKRPPPPAYPFPNRQCIERTTRGPRPSVELGTIRVIKPCAAITRDVSGTPRSPWEPRLYGRVIGVSNLKLQIRDGRSRSPKSTSNLWYCCGLPGVPASICSEPPLGTKSTRRCQP